MALVHADDFQQLVVSGTDNLKGAGLYQATLSYIGELARAEFTAMGLETPTLIQGSGGQAARLMTLLYDTNKGALQISQARTDYLESGCSGYRRPFVYAGDTLYIGVALEFGGLLTPTGNFLFVGDKPGQTTYTPTDGIGNNLLYSVGVNSSGFFTFNDVATTQKAYDRPAVYKVYLDLVFTPTTMELWYNNRQIATQARSNIRLKEIAVSCGKMITADTQDFCIWLHSIIIADSVTPGYAQRVGRRSAKTEPLATVTANGSPVVAVGNTDPAAVLKRYAEGPTLETGTFMFGSLSSAAATSVNTFTGTRVAKKPLAAAVNIQAKRLYPSGDGLGPMPFLTVAGTKYSGPVMVPKQTWKEQSYEVLIDQDLDFSSYSFGYEHGYLTP